MQVIANARRRCHRGSRPCKTFWRGYLRLYWAAQASHVCCKGARELTYYTDNAFVNTFFLSYRRFCEPPEVLSYLLERWFEIVNSTGMARQYLLWCQMRFVTVRIPEVGC
jgi:hypothetical protein